MPTAKYFSKCPEFPSDIPVANVPTVSYELLQQRDTEESLKLFRACREYGFFLLDLKNSSHGQALLQDAEAMFDLTNETFDLDPELLSKYASNPPRNLNGYKSYGNGRMLGGYPDVTSMYVIGQDDMLEKRGTPTPQPSTIVARKPQCQSFFLHSHEIVTVLLSSLDGPLGLPSGTLSSLCSLDKPSDTGVRMLKTHPESMVPDQSVTLGAHTDLGTITLLFNVLGGLQILPIDTPNEDENWRYIKPEQGCAVVNLGDTLVQWTGGVLRSSLHRVRNPPGAQANATRQSLAYLVRPSKDSSMQRIKGSQVIPVLAEDDVEEDISVDDWMVQRTKAIIENKWKPQTIGGVPITAVGS